MVTGALMARHVNVESLACDVLQSNGDVPDRRTKAQVLLVRRFPKPTSKIFRVIRWSWERRGRGPDLSRSKAMAILRALEDVNAHMVAQRTRGNGDYEERPLRSPIHAGHVKFAGARGMGRGELVKVHGLGAAPCGELHGPRNE